MSAGPLSQSPLWRWSAQFYERAATEAWSKGIVPWRLTNSVRVAEAYGRLISAWRTDLIAAGFKAPDAPVEVLELGGGAGRLAFHLVRWLEQAKVPFQLTWSDAAASNVAAFNARTFVQERAGAVEAVKLDVLQDPMGPPLAPDVVIGSYLFDTLPHDAWAVRGGRLVEQHVRVELPPGTAPECERAELHWADVETDAPAFVRGYAPRVGEGGFMLPVGALQCLKRVTEWSTGRCLVLAADKGEPDVAAVQAGGSPKLQRHGGISAMVNFDAIRAWWGWRPFLRSAQAEPDLGFYALAQGLKALPVTRMTWSASFGAESLLHRLRELDALLQGEASVPQLLQALAAWRFDPDVFVRMAEPLRASKPTPEEAAALVAAIDHTWENHFEVGGDLDVAFEMATVLHRIGQLTRAAHLYERSLELHGRHATACFNLGLCRLDLGDRDQGAMLLKEVLELQPGHAAATRILAQL
ncbi:MAG: hypothetical protein JNK82_40790 [Myxococcaceae bacterium]|nr:hypothetical protein [Myxococcaceae bacterium]